MIKIINAARKKSCNTYFLKSFVLLFASFYLVLSTSQPSAAKPPKSTLDPPTSVKASPVSEHQNDLQWQYDSNKIDGFSIERSTTPDAGFSEVATADKAATSYLDSGLASETSYFYRIRAFKNAGNDTTYSSYSETVSASTLSATNPGAFTFDVAGYTVNEGDGSVDITINRVGGSDGIVTVDWRTSGNTATAGEDYGDLGWTTLTFADGETSKTESIAIVDDTAAESDETFDVLLDNPTGGATLDTITTATVTIADNDSTTTDSTSDSTATANPGAFTFEVASYAVNEGAGTVDITINRVGGSDGIVTVDWRTSGNTATHGEDYGDFSWTTLTFADGETSKTESITIVDDTIVESDETFDVLLDNPTGGATLDTITTATVTIADNDSTTTDSTSDSTATASPGAFTFEVAGYSVNEGDGSVAITINRVGGSDGIATVDWRTKGVTASYGEDYGDFSWTTLTFADGETSKTESIAIIDDSTAESDETFDVLLDNPTGGATLGSTTTTRITIVDNDEASTSEPASDLGYLPVFPGAQGFGTETKAGRGGKIIKVTNLDNSGSGSLRAALEASGPRIVVFEVSGTIVLTDAIRIRNPYLTLAGQTAPSPGITIKGAVLDVRTHDVLIQHIRSRIGDDNPGDIAPENLDAMQIRELGTTENPEDVANVILDHVSLSWAVDENLGFGGKYTPHDLTVSNCIISEALYDSIHPKGPHSMGILVGDRTKNVTLIGNLLAHNRGRNGGCWKGDTSGVALNNLLYNAGYVNYLMGDNYDSGPAYISIIGNVAIDGVNTPDSNPLVQFQSNISPGTEVHITGNKVDSGNLLKNSASFDPRVSSPPVWHQSLVVRDANKVESWVLANAGARPADRDDVDERVVNEVKSRTGNIIDSQQEVGGWPTLKKNYREFTIPDDPHGDDDGDGYTNIEEVLHEMAAQVEGR